jgi:hypothetical protein
VSEDRLSASFIEASNALGRKPLGKEAPWAASKKKKKKMNSISANYALVLFQRLFQFGPWF